MKKISAIFTILISILLISHDIFPAQDAKRDADIRKNNTTRNESADKYEDTDDTQFPVKFREVWGYLMRGEEKMFRGDEPVTDVCYFSCGLNSNGRINVNVTPPSLPDVNGTRRRIHIVIADLENTKMMNHVLDPSKGAREYLVADIIEVSKKYDGVQIDFEAVSNKDAANFQEFLKMIKSGLESGKTLSVALPAKTVKVDDAYDYKTISAIVDKVYIMAYDQHWSTSKPGPVASLSWCRNIMTYAKNEIPSDKLIMGIPLYGRSWKNMKITTKIHPKKKYAKGAKKKKKQLTITVTRHVIKSRSVKSSHIPELISSKNAVKEYSPETGFKIKYKGKSKEILYCDDVNATMEKFLYYRGFVDSIGFWRLGMESREMWNEILIEND